MKKYLMAFDQGTTSSRAVIFDKKGIIRGIGQKEYRQIFPRPGWVEHDPADILGSQIGSAGVAFEMSGIGPDEIAAVGITNQRETSLMWERKTGKPLYNAIVWQCRRTADLTKRLVAEGLESMIREKTGLLPDPYFSGTKIMWLLDNIPGLRRRAENGEIMFGTVDSWLIFNLTGKHLTDPSNASRTMLYNIKSGEWDKDILKALDIPEVILPEVERSAGDFGMIKKSFFGCDIPLRGVLGDQQAALFGQTCFEEGSAKNTYGTGGFALLNIGRKPRISENGLLTTVAWDTGDGPIYAFEGSVFVAGAAVQWLRDGLGIIERSQDCGAVSESVEGCGGVYVVPAFTGLGAPYWDPEARGAVLGITRGTKKEHIVRAVNESIAYQTFDLIEAMVKEYGSSFKELKVDGGAAGDRFLLQFQADILGFPVSRPKVLETTALGASYMAGLSIGCYSGLEDIKSNWQEDKKFFPSMKEEERKEKIAGWHRAVAAAREF